MASASIKAKRAEYAAKKRMELLKVVYRMSPLTRPGFRATLVELKRKLVESTVKHGQAPGPYDGPVLQSWIASSTPE